ncbi:DUF3795 domain-containing protein [Bacteroides ovatus]|nr:DUF3795 domain-containing protein [Bacteroides ovatus]MCS2526230.1 DUF3795 domain-containing protein [Bacteroides ovatus]
MRDVFLPAVCSAGDVLRIQERKNPCKGAELNSSRCEKCKTFHLCCLEKEITHCFQCSSFPCARFKGFTKRWLKYGQNFIENQKLLSEIGEVAFLEYYNKKVTD